MVSCALSGVQMRPRTNSGHSLSRFSVPLLPKPHLLGVHESNKRDFWQSCAVKFLRGTILHLSSQAHLQGEERMTLWEVIAFLEAPPIEKSWKELIVSQAGDEGIGRIAAEAGELMLNSPGPVAVAILGTGFS